MIVKRLSAGHAGRAGIAITVVLVLLALFAPILAPHDPAIIDPSRSFEPSSARFPLGTDNLGRDLLSRLLYGARWSLGVVAVATVLVMSIGLAVGILAGYLGGIVDAALMRLVDALLAVPSLLLGLAVVGTLGPGLPGLMIGLSSIWWVSYARVVRGMVVSLRERGFVDAARALGAGHGEIVGRHILPGILPSVCILATLEMGQLILAISGLSFLGLGAQPPHPEWGAMLSDGRRFFFEAPRLVVLPGLAVSIAVIGFNLLGDGLRDALAPDEAWQVRGVSQ